MSYNIQSTLNEVIINQMVTNTTTSQKEMKDIKYIRQNDTFVPEPLIGYTIDNPYVIDSNNCIIASTTDCNNVIINPPSPTEPDPDINPYPEPDPDPVEDPEYPNPCDDENGCLFITPSSEVDLYFLCKVNKNAIPNSKCGNTIGKGSQYDYNLSQASVYELINNGGSSDIDFSGESIPLGNGNKITINSNNSYTLSPENYYRAYKQYPVISYSVKQSICPNDEESEYEEVTSSLEGVSETQLCYNIYTDWSDFMGSAVTALKNKYGESNIIWINNILTINDTTAKEHFDLLLNYVGVNTICLYFSQIEIGNTTYAVSNLAYDPYDFSNVTSLTKFNTVVNRLKSQTGIKEGSDILYDNISVNDYYGLIANDASDSNNIIINYSLSTVWLKVFDMVGNTEDVNGNVLAISSLIAEKLNNGSKCRSCGGTGCEELNSDGSINGLHVSTKFVIINRTPTSKSGNTWNYSYTLKAFNKSNNLTFKNTVVKKSEYDEKTVEETDPITGDWISTTTTKHSYTDYKRVFMDYPFIDSSYYDYKIKENPSTYASVGIRKGMFNSFDYSYRNKYIGGTIHNIVEEKEVTDDSVEISTVSSHQYDEIEVDSYDYTNHGDSVHNCEITKETHEHD